MRSRSNQFVGALLAGAYLGWTVHRTMSAGTPGATQPAENDQDDPARNGAVENEQHLMLTSAAQMILLTLFIAVLAHILNFLLPGVVTGEPATYSFDLRKFLPHLANLHTTVEAELVAPTVLAVGAIAMTLFVAVSISNPTGHNRGAASWARDILLDGAARVTMAFGAVICWCALPYLALGASRTWPGAVLIAALATLLSFLAPLSQPHTALHRYYLAHASNDIDRLTKAITKLERGVKRPSVWEGPVARWAGVTVWTLVVTLVGSAVLQYTLSLWPASVIFGLLVVGSVPLLIPWAVSRRVNAYRRGVIPEKLPRLRKGDLWFALPQTILTVVIVLRGTELMQISPAATLTVIVVSAAAPWLAWLGGHSLGHYAGLERAYARMELRRAHGIREFQLERLRAERSPGLTS